MANGDDQPGAEDVIGSGLTDMAIVLDSEIRMNMVFIYHGLRIELDAKDIPHVNPGTFEQACRDMVRVLYGGDNHG